MKYLKCINNYSDATKMYYENLTIGKIYKIIKKVSIYWYIKDDNNIEKYFTQNSNFGKFFIDAEREIKLKRILDEKDEKI